MQPHAIVRGVGVAGLVLVYFIYAVNAGLDGRILVPFLGEIQPLVLLVLAIVVLVSPETIDRLPFGPSN